MKEDRLIGWAIIGFGAFMYYQADLLPPPMFGTLGPAVFPKIVLILLILTGGGLILQQFIRDRRASAEVKTPPAQRIEKIKKSLRHYEWVILTLLCFFGYVLLMDFAGYLISTLVFILALMWLIGPRTRSSLLVIFITTLIMSFGLYYGFMTFFDVVLPEGQFF